MDRQRRQKDGATHPAPTEPGRYAEFYALLATALRGGGLPPVDPMDAVGLLDLIERVLSDRDVT